MTFEEMKEIEERYDNYIVEVGSPRDCETCPFEEHCGDAELFWGCGVWEDEMGEDL